MIADKALCKTRAKMLTWLQLYLVYHCKQKNPFKSIWNQVAPWVNFDPGVMTWLKLVDVHLAMLYIKYIEALDLAVWDNIFEEVPF